MLFEQVEAECPLSVFIITIGTIQFSLNVTSSDIERGNVTFDLPLNISSVAVCSVVGVVSGVNDIGQSEPVDIHLPPGNVHMIICGYRNGYHIWHGDICVTEKCNYARHLFIVRFALV